MDPSAARQLKSCNYGRWSSFERSQRKACHSHHENMLPANKLKPLCWCCFTEREITGSPLGVLVKEKKPPMQMPLEILVETKTTVPMKEQNEKQES